MRIYRDLKGQKLLVSEERFKRIRFLKNTPPKDWFKNCGLVDANLPHECIMQDWTKIHTIDNIVMMKRR